LPIGMGFAQLSFVSCSGAMSNSTLAGCTSVE